MNLLGYDAKGKSEPNIFSQMVMNPMVQSVKNNPKQTKGLTFAILGGFLLGSGRVTLRVNTLLSLLRDLLSGAKKTAVSRPKPRDSSKSCSTKNWET